MPKQTIAKYVREIKRLNARFRKLKKRDGGIKKRYVYIADQIATRKSALENAMQADCQHPKAFEEDAGISDVIGPRRICRVCGLTEWCSNLKRLDSATTTILDNDTFLIEKGKLLKKLGFNF